MAQNCSAWLEVCAVAATDQKSLLQLGRGEREAILLAEQKRAQLLLIDEKRGRAEAERRGISSTGTLGVLLEAAKRGILNPQAALQQLLAETTFRATVAVQNQFLESCKNLQR